MTTVLLAMTDPILRFACSHYIEEAGGAAIALERPLSVLGLAARLQVDAVVADDSDIGRSVAVVAREVWPSVPVVVVAPVPGAQPIRGVTLPLAAEAFLDALLSTRSGGAPPGRPRLQPDATRRRAPVDDSEGRLRGAQDRLLFIRLERSLHQASFQETLRLLRGRCSIQRGANALRGQVRSLCSRLAGAGLRIAVQSRRGRGYAFVR